MQAVRRFAGSDPGTIVDAGIVIAAVGLIAVAVDRPPGLIGTTPIAGPSWLLALLPLLMGAPLVLRRRAPLLMWAAIWAALALQSVLAAGRYNEALDLRFGPHHETPAAFTFVLFAAAYALGAHASLRRAAAGLILAVPVVAEISHHGGLGLAFSSGDGSAGAAALSFLQLLAFWLVGVFVHARRRAASLAARSAALQRQAEQAATAERARIARELHDIVAHHLSVIVLQAAGTRASGRPAGAALEKIESSARQALAETRRLLGVLHDPDEAAGLGPQPGIGELGALADAVRAAGMPVNLVIDGDLAGLPATVDVSVYRIVQEALTNVLKHAGPARADVTVGWARETLTVEITDDGTAEPDRQPLASGHGLAGMRERVAVFGGELHAGPRPGGGFAVLARLPLAEGLPPVAPP
ncbi:MAG: sensor histidine kinase [Trebonia sp.]